MCLGLLSDSSLGYRVRRDFETSRRVFWMSLTGIFHTSVSDSASEQPLFNRPSMIFLYFNVLGRSDRE